MSQSSPKYHFADTFYIRTPTLPLNFFYNLVNQPEISDEEFLVRWNIPVIREAIYLASPDFYDAMEDWAASKLTKAKRIESIKSKFLSYLIRMSTRCTPFGLFAGVGMGKFGHESMIIKKPLGQQSRTTRLDMHFICNVWDHIAESEAIKYKARYKCNDSLYEVANHYRYMKYTFEKDIRKYNIHGVTKTEHLSQIISKTHSYTAFEEIVSLLVSQGHDAHASKDYILKLIALQVLTSEFTPSVTLENMKSILNLQKVYHDKGSTNALLKTVKGLCQDLDTTYCSNAKDKYTTIENTIQELGLNYDRKNLLQTDTFQHFDRCELNQRFGYQVLRAVQKVNLIFKSNSNKHLTEFRSKFIERYEHKEVPLNTALDVEMGIGYGNSAKWNSSSFLNEIFKFNDEASEDIVENKIIEHIKTSTSPNKHVINLYDTLSKVENKELNLSHNFYVLSELLEEDGKELIYIKAIGFSAAKLLCRFSHLNDDLNLEIKDMNNYHNTESDIIYAEIVHLPQSRIGNILHRNNSHEYEIPYLCKSSKDDNHQIPVNDILISIQNNRVILRSVKLNKQIIPRNTNAHNYSLNPLPIYDFLSSVQAEHHSSSIGFNLYNNKDQKYTPRIIYNNIILQKAKWTLAYEDLSELKSIIHTPNYEDKVKEWREKMAIPSVVLIGSSDNIIPINFQNINCIKLLLSNVSSGTQKILTEFIKPIRYNTDHDSNLYTNECIFTYKTH